MAQNLIRWPIRNDQIVMMRISGATQDEVAAAFGISKRQVRNIEQDPRAQEIVAQAKAKVQEKLIETMDEDLDLTAKLSLRVLRRTLEADINPIHQAKANQDRTAIALLRGRGFLSKDGESNQQGFQMSTEQSDKLLAAIAKSDRAAKVNPFEPPTIEVPCEVVEETG